MKPSCVHITVLNCIRTNNRHFFNEFHIRLTRQLCSHKNLLNGRDRGKKTADTFTARDVELAIGIVGFYSISKFMIIRGIRSECLINRAKCENILL